MSPSVGLSFINITTNEAVLSQICDTQFYVRTIHKLQMYEPSTILMVNTVLPPNPKSNLLSIIEVELPATAIEPLDRKYWSEHVGLEFIQSLAFRDDLEAIKVAIGGNFYATCSFAAVRNSNLLFLSSILLGVGSQVCRTILSRVNCGPFLADSISAIGKHDDDRSINYSLSRVDPESAGTKVKRLSFRPFEPMFNSNGDKNAAEQYNTALKSG